MNLIAVQAFAGIATFLVAAFALYRSVSWNRKKATIEKLEAYDYYDSTAYLEGKVNFYMRKSPIPEKTITEEIEKESEFLNHMFRILQFHSALVRGAETATYKRSIVENNRSHAITRTFYLFHKYIDQRRLDLNLPGYYDEIERFALRSALEGKGGHKDIKRWAEDRIGGEPVSHVAKEVAAERKKGRLFRWSRDLRWWLRDLVG